MLSYPRKSAQRYKLIVKNKNFEKSCRKICRIKNYAYLCNPKTNKAVVVKW